MSENKKSENKSADFVIDEKGDLDQPDIAKKEKASKSISVKGESKRKRFINWYKTNKKKSIPITLIAILALLLLIPFTRYQIAGTVLKNNYSLQLNDSTTGTPVSGADVSVGSIHAITNGNGQATLKNV